MLVLETLLYMALVARPDVSGRLGPAVCGESTDNRPLAAWKLGIFDAQLDGRKVALRAGRSPDEEELTRKAHSLAQTRGYSGFASGLCPDGTGWAAATPAPEPLAVAKNGTITLPKVLDRACESFRVDFAGRTGAPRALGAVRTVDGKTLGDGVVSVTCQPEKPRFRGPVLWYLAPTGQGPAEDVPEAAALAGGTTTASQLIGWVNAVRRAEGLNAVVFKKDLSEEAGVLAIDPTLAHDRAMLRKVGDSLDARNVRLLGEDRVKGATAAAMAWLLWTSPRHRELLLSKDATAGGIAVKDVRGEALAVLVFGADRPLNTAKAGRKAGTRPKSAKN